MWGSEFTVGGFWLRNNMFKVAGSFGRDTVQPHSRQRFNDGCLALQMPGVTVKDVNQQEFVRALAAFLKK